MKFLYFYFSYNYSEDHKWQLCSASRSPNHGTHPHSWLSHHHWPIIILKTSIHHSPCMDKVIFYVSNTSYGTTNSSTKIKYGNLKH